MEALYVKIVGTTEVLTRGERRMLRVPHSVLASDVSEFRNQLSSIRVKQQEVGNVTWTWLQEVNDWEDMELEYKNRFRIKVGLHVLGVL